MHVAIVVLVLCASVSFAAKGPVGWNNFRSLDLLANLRTGEQTKQFSSFDRKGGNDDGGPFECLRHSDDGWCVLAEVSGPGEIDSIWFTRDNGDAKRTGSISIVLDGKSVLEAPLQNVVNGSLGSPFVWPLVGNGDDTAGGDVIKVPMPFRKSMLISVQHEPIYYHVTYRQFSDDEGVQTFDPKDPARDVLEKLRHFGIKDPKPTMGDIVAAKSGSISAIQPGQRGLLAEFAQSGWITEIRLQIPQVSRAPFVEDDGRAFGNGGFSTFTVAIDPANRGVRITRRIDSSVGFQKARLLVHGRHVGDWDNGTPLPIATFSDQTIEIPESFTKGLQTLVITNEFISSKIDFNEFRYDVHCKIGDVWLRTDALDVGPSHPGEEIAHNYLIVGQTWSGYGRRHRYTRSAQEVKDSLSVLDTKLSFSFDSKQPVSAPIGEFFGSGLGKYDVRSLMFSMDSTDGGWMTAWWPMPFAKSAKLEIVNDGNVPINVVNYQITYNSDEKVAKELTVNGKLGYFRVQHSRSICKDKEDFNFLYTQGRGVYYGVTQTMRGHIPPKAVPARPMRNYLEGDERVFVDGLLTPQIYGTGTEDFYEGGWYFRDETYTMPLAGAPAHKNQNDFCQFDCSSAYRLMIHDAVSYSSSLEFNIEHGPINDEPGEYSSTSYYYSQPSWTIKETDRVESVSTSSRKVHNYTASQERSYQLQQAFEGRTVPYQAIDQVSASKGQIQFTINIDDENHGVRLLRQSDQEKAYQRVNVSVDGKFVGEWLQALGNQYQRWLQDTFDIPKKFTRGKKSATVKLQSTSTEWTASHYKVLSIVDPYLS